MTLLSTPDHTELTETMAKHNISALQQVEEGSSPAFQSRAGYRGHPAILQLIGTCMHVTAERICQRRPCHMQNTIVSLSVSLHSDGAAL